MHFAKAALKRNRFARNAFPDDHIKVLLPYLVNTEPSLKICIACEGPHIVGGAVVDKLNSLVAVRWRIMLGNYRTFHQCSGCAIHTCTSGALIYHQLLRFCLRNYLTIVHSSFFEKIYFMQKLWNNCLSRMCFVF